VPRATAPQLVAPAQGGTYQSPITFQWQGSLRSGQSYQVQARQAVKGYAIQSGLLTQESWTVDLPAEQHGDWRWTVSVIQGGSVAATSSEGMFWFDPQPGGGDGDNGNGENGDDGKPTPKP
jgi:hypothetical protein